MAVQNVNRLPFQNVNAEIRTIFGQYYGSTREKGVELRPVNGQGQVISSTVYSMVDGTILEKHLNDSTYGNYIIIKDNNSSNAFLYGGLYNILVNVNDTVTNHQSLASVSTALELQIQNITTSWYYSSNISDYINPADWIPYTEIVGDTLDYSYTPPTPPPPPPPTPTTKKNKFPWVLYAEKFRNRY